MKSISATEIVSMFKFNTKEAMRYAISKTNTIMKQIKAMYGTIALHYLKDLAQDIINQKGDESWNLFYLKARTFSEVEFNNWLSLKLIEKQEGD